MADLRGKLGDAAFETHSLRRETTVLRQKLVFHASLEIGVQTTLAGPDVAAALEPREPPAMAAVLRRVRSGASDERAMSDK